MDKQTAHFLRQRATHRCEYCHLPEAASNLKHVPDHVLAKQHGGKENLDNLALCCVRCNQHKGPNIAGIDRETGTMVRLFDPRRDQWAEHFKYDGPVMVGRTKIGRVTIAVLAINLPLRIAARRGLLTEGVKFS